MTASHPCLIKVKSILTLDYFVQPCLEADQVISVSETSSPLPEASANFSKDVKLNVKHYVTFMLVYLIYLSGKICRFVYFCQLKDSISGGTCLLSLVLWTQKKISASSAVRRDCSSDPGSV